MFTLTYGFITAISALYEHYRQRNLKSAIVANRKLEQEKLLLEEANKTIKKLSETDALTGVYNRRQFERMLEKETKRCLRYGKTFSLLFIDVDHFKEVNDQKGHQAGDFALQELAKILEDGLRDGTDWVARYGGEEFVISTLETEEASAFKLGERLRKTVESKEFRFEGQNLRLTVSIGVASLPVHNAKVEVESVIADLVKRADACLYQAKDEGRNRTIAYSF